MFVYASWLSTIYHNSIHTFFSWFSNIFFNVPDVCENTVCGPNSDCVRNNHVATCICRSGYEGNPVDIHIGCRPKPVACSSNTDCPSNTYCYGDICRPSCQSDEECSLTEKCLQGQCNNPCEQRSACGMNADCRVFSHVKQCSCPPGFTGNQEVECVRSKWEICYWSLNP